MDENIRYWDDGTDIDTLDSVLPMNDIHTTNHDENQIHLDIDILDPVLPQNEISTANDDQNQIYPDSIAASDIPPVSSLGSPPSASASAVTVSPDLTKSDDLPFDESIMEIERMQESMSHSAEFPEAHTSLTSVFEGTLMNSKSSAVYHDEISEETDLEGDIIREGTVREQLMDPIAELLQNLIDNGTLDHTHFFYKYIKNSLQYVNWLVKRHKNPCLQFQWDQEIIEFCETLEYHGHEKVMHILRGEAHYGSGRGGIKSFCPEKWNLPLPSKSTRKKNKSGYTTDDGIHYNKLRAFLELAGADDSLITPLFSNHVLQIIPVICGKDGMQIKPGLITDKRQGILVGATERIDAAYARNNLAPDNDYLRNIMVTEAEAITLSTADNSFGIPIGVNYVPKGVKGDTTAEEIRSAAKITQVCLTHLREKSVDIQNGIIRSTDKCIPVDCAECNEIKDSLKSCINCTERVLCYVHHL